MIKKRRCPEHLTVDLDHPVRDGILYKFRAAAEAEFFKDVRLDRSWLD